MSPRRVVAAVLLAVLAAIGLAGCGSSSGGSGGAQGTAVGAEEFQQRVDGDGVVVLDVRTPAEFSAGHLPDALNVDAQAGDFDERLAELDPEATYAVYCQSGNRSGVAVDRMVEARFTDVVHLDGGIAAWQDAGGTVVTP